MAKRASSKRLGVAAAAALLAIAACGGGDPVEDWDPAGPQLVVDVTSERPVDRLTLVVGTGQLVPGGVVTPAMLAAGRAESPDDAHYVAFSFVSEPLGGASDHRFVVAAPGLQARSPTAVLVIGESLDAADHEAITGVGSATLELASRSAGMIRQTVQLHPDLVPSVELWGHGKLCAKLDSTYFLDDLDPDCDGLVDDDCDKGRYCDPSATDPAAQAGCTASSCGRCGLGGETCALGTQVTCRNVAGMPPVYTCAAGGACGAPTCLPAAACQLSCLPSGKDPLPCLETAWESGAQPAEAIRCALPTRGTPSSGSYTCPGGSAVEVALPFRGCANPSVLVAYSSDEAASASIIAPCTLHVAVRTGDPMHARSQLIRLDTETGEATVRVHLTPSDGDCAHIGTCDAAASAATCEQ